MICLPVLKLSLGAFENMADTNIDCQAIQARLGAHLLGLSALAAELEILISSALAQLGENDINHLQGLQQLDFLRQSLEDVAHLSTAMSQLPATSLQSEGLAGQIRLETTRALINGDNSTRDTSGDFDLL